MIQYKRSRRISQLNRYILERNDLQSRGLVSRVYSLRLDSLSEKDRSVEAVIATEAPVVALDWQSFEPVLEVLLMSGANLPETRQVPMLATHGWSTDRKILGSTQMLRIEGKKLIGRNVFSQNAEGEKAFNLVRERRLKDNSISYRVIEHTIIERGTQKTIQGRVFKATTERPLRVVTAWEVKENSICEVGADATAKTRDEKGANLPDDNEL